jgi:molybdate transport system substrate-binding protein
MIRLRTAMVAAAVCLAGAAQAATIKALCDSPLEPALPAIAEAFRKATGHSVTFAFAPSPAIRKRVADGEAADLVIVQPDISGALAQQGKVDPGDHPAFARIGIGLAARADAAARDIGAADALKQALLKADTILFNTIASGNYFAAVLEKLGLADAVKAKVTRTAPAETFDRLAGSTGDAVAVGTIPQIRADRRLRLLGALPAELQRYLQYAAVPTTGTTNMKAVVAFIRFLSTPAAKAQLAAAGVE